MKCNNCTCKKCKNYECEYHCKDMTDLEKQICDMDVSGECDCFKGEKDVRKS
jgi:hypothetical protein